VKNDRGEFVNHKPNIVIIMTDQHRADVCAREGFPLDTTPFLDSLAHDGVWFNRAYTAAPICVAARVSMLTGRYPNATRVRSNHNTQDATYEKDIFDVMHEQEYATAMVGKNHSHLTPDRVDHWFSLGHGGGTGEDRTEQEKAFDQYLRNLKHRADMNPAPFPLECQGPYRAVSDAQKWISTLEGKPFFLWLTFAEPHNPYQVPEPYFSMFPIESLPPVHAGTEVLASKGFKWEWTYQLGKRAFPDYDEQVPRARANYFGMLRLIDDQIKRFVEFLDSEGLRENTILLFTSDHGDFVGEYGLVRKGPEMPELLMRIPLLFNGPGIESNSNPHPAHVSIVDIMPTLCKAIGVPMQVGVQGRSLWPLLDGTEPHLNGTEPRSLLTTYPVEEFASVYAEQGFGGLHYTEDDDLSPVEEGCLADSVSFDCLNSWTQSGTMRMLRKGDWKLVFDMQGRGQLYNLSRDPVELNNLYDNPEYKDVQLEMLAEVFAWSLRAQDPLPLPRRRYIMKTNPRNYWSS